MISKILKSVVVASLLVAANMAFADFATCPAAIDAQKIFASHVSKLAAVSTPPSGWYQYQATSADQVTIDYYTQKIPSDNLNNHVWALSTFIDGAPQYVDVAAVGTTPAMRHCYYPDTSGELDATGLPKVPTDPIPVLDGKAQVLALEYAAGVHPTPGILQVDVTFVFPVTAPITVDWVKLTGTSGIYQTISAKTPKDVIDGIPDTTTPISYTYSASDEVIGATKYCAASGTVSVGEGQPNSITVTYSTAACSGPPPVQTTDVSVSFKFNGVTPPATVSSVTLTDPSTDLSYSVAPASTSGATITGVPTSVAGISYNYTAAAVMVSSTKYCVANGATTISTTQHSFELSYTTDACSTPPPPTNNPLVISYLLLGSKTADQPLGYLNLLLNDLQRTPKTSFNRLVLSFIQPTLYVDATHHVTSNNLACTGILGYYCDPQNLSNYASAFTAQQTQGAADFTALKAAIAQIQGNGIEVFIAVGGWDYSCNNPEYFKQISSNCEPVGQPQNYDWFPDPSTQSVTAQNSYQAVVQLAKDLGAAGVDLDYEEMWHADKYLRHWNNSQFITALSQWGKTAQDAQNTYDAMSYSDLLTNYSTTDNYGPYVMPLTVAKFVGIVNDLATARAQIFPLMKLSTAAPPVGAIPVMTPQNSDVFAVQHGGLWWGGNLKGLIYEAEMSSPGILDNFDSINVMTYDLGAGSKSCGSPLPYNCDLQSQVEFFMSTYSTWLKGIPKLQGPLQPAGQAQIGQWIVPKQLNYKGHLGFGFEIGQPAYPAPTSGDGDWHTTVITSDKLAAILASIGHNPAYGSMILWQTYKPISSDSTIIGTQATPRDVLNATCAAFGLGGLGYNCNSPIPIVIPPSLVQNSK